jgi:hypothetical protein
MKFLLVAFTGKTVHALWLLDIQTWRTTLKRIIIDIIAQPCHTIGLWYFIFCFNKMLAQV